jgi:hypothetical protein
VGYSSDEDQVSTSPLRLLQAIDLYLARLQDGGAGEGRALLSAHSNVSAPQMRVSCVLAPATKPWACESLSRCC